MKVEMRHLSRMAVVIMLEATELSATLLTTATSVLPIGSGLVTTLNELACLGRSSVFC
jgi:hypothetical protein